MRLPCTQTLAIYAVTESTGATGHVTESLALRGSVEGYVWRFGAKWGHQPEGNRSLGAWKAIVPYGTTVAAGDVVVVGSSQFRAASVSSPGNHHTEIELDHM